MSGNVKIFALVKVTHAQACLTSGKIFSKPTAGWMVTPERGGFLVLRLAVRAKLWFYGVIGSGQKCVRRSQTTRESNSFCGGHFSFSFPFMFFPEVVSVSFVFFFLVIMAIQVNSILTKSRNPTEHGFKLEGENGNIIQQLPDGYNLVEFKQFKIQKKMKFGKIKKTKMSPLQWYIHFDDITFLP